MRTSDPSSSMSCVSRFSTSGSATATSMREPSRCVGSAPSRRASSSVEERDDFGIDLGAAEVDDGEAELLGEHVGERALTEQLELDEQVAEPLARSRLLRAALRSAAPRRRARDRRAARRAGGRCGAWRVGFGSSRVARRRRGAPSGASASRPARRSRRRRTGRRPSAAERPPDPGRAGSCRPPEPRRRRSGSSAWWERGSCARRRHRWRGRDRRALSRDLADVCVAGPGVVSTSSALTASSGLAVVVSPSRVAARVSPSSGIRARSGQAHRVTPLSHARGATLVLCARHMPDPSPGGGHDGHQPDASPISSARERPDSIGIGDFPTTERGFGTAISRSSRNARRGRECPRPGTSRRCGGRPRRRAGARTRPCAAPRR